MVNVNIGRMRHRIVIQELQEVSDGGGGFIEDWVDVVTVWADVEPLQSREYFEAQQTQVELTHRVKMRFRASLTTAHRLKHKDRALAIQSIINVDERNVELRVLCAEVAG